MWGYLIGTALCLGAAGRGHSQPSPANNKLFIVNGAVVALVILGLLVLSKTTEQRLFWLGLAGVLIVFVVIARRIRK
jgi:hypothetical protein